MGRLFSELVITERSGVWSLSSGLAYNIILRKLLSDAKKRNKLRKVVKKCVTITKR